MLLGGRWLHVKGCALSLLHVRRRLGQLEVLNNAQLKLTELGRHGVRRVELSLGAR